MFYALKSSAFLNQVDARTIETVQKSIKVADLKYCTVPLPSLLEQKEIARTLAAFDDKIEFNRKMNRTLEAMAQALFKAWFVDFKPVKAKAAGRTPESCDAETAALFPDEFVDSELGAIPKGWEVKRVSDIARLNSLILRSSDKLSHLDYIEISAVSNGDVSEIVRYERGNEPSRAKRRLQHGDTVLSTVRPERGSYFLCLHPSEYLIASTGFAVISPHQDAWAFVYAALTRSEVFENLGHLADGGAYPAIRPEIIGNLLLVVPTKDSITDRYQKAASSIYERVEANKIESRTLAILRDSLLPKLISGQLRIPDAEALAEAAV